MSPQDILARIALVPRWLHDVAALFCIHLIRGQTQRGSLLEIGVFRGRFLALMRCAAPDDCVVGIEPNAAPDDIRQGLRPVLGALRELDIWCTDSQSLTSTALLDRMGAAARFIHIDGAHTEKEVHHDLTICEAALIEGGIIAMDDAFNFSIPGVTSAIYRYFYEREAAPLAPFAHCYNKLFLTTPEHHAFWLADAHGYAANAGQTAMAPTLQRVAHNHALGYVPTLFGYEILPFL